MILGLSEMDARVYIYLAKKGPLRSKDLAAVLKARPKPICRCLKNLQRKGIVSVACEPAWFFAISFDRVIEIIVKAKEIEARDIQQNRAAILYSWRSAH